MPKADTMERNGGRWGALRRGIANEAGSATVEAALWIPFFLLLIALIADASFLFNRQAQMLRSVQDVNRAFSTGQIQTPEELQEILAGQYAGLSDNVRVSSSLDTGSVPGETIRTSLSIPARDVVSIGIISNLTSFDLTVVAEHYREF
jgi:Flp pilus assembly protein TadG